MAVTTTARMLLTRWSAGTDPVTRAQLDASHANLEAYAGRFETAGLLSARPAAGIRERFYYATDNGVLYRDSGSAWEAVGANVAGGAVDKMAAGQSAPLREFRNAAGTVLARLDIAGRMAALNVTGGATRTAAPAARATRGTGQLVAHGSGGNGEKVGLDTTEYATDAGMVALATDRLTALVAGLYTARISGQWEDNTAGYRRVMIWRYNSAGVSQEQIGNVAPGSALNTLQSATLENKFAAGDYIEGWVQQTSGAGLSVFNPTLTLRWVGETPP